MARWSQIADNPAYQALPPEQQQAVQEEFFQQNIAPAVPADKMDEVRAMWDSQFAKPTTPLQKAEQEQGSKSWLEKMLPNKDEWKRQAGLGARTAIEGALAPLATLSDAAILPYDIAAMFTGAPQMQEQNAFISNALTRMGLPEPQGVLENTTNIVGGGLTGAGAQTMLAREVKNALVDPTARRVVGALAGERAAPAREAVMAPAAQSARKMGYVMTPSSLRNTWVARTLESLVGSRKPLVEHNQEVTDKVVRNLAGVSEHVPLNEEQIDAAMKPWGRAYQDVERVMPYLTLDTDFIHSKLMPKIMEAEPSMSRSLGGTSLVPGGRKIPNPGRARNMFKNTKFPPAPSVPGAPFPSGLAKSVVEGREFTEVPGKYLNTKEAMEAIKELRKGATADFKAAAEKGGSKLRRKAIDQQRAADELENLVERNLREFGSQKIYDNFVTARRELAKLHTAKRAFSPKTGHVGATKLAKNYKRLSGDLKNVARAKMHFPHDIDASKGGPLIPPVEAGGGALGTLLGLFYGHPLEYGMGGAAAGAAAKKLAERFMLSDEYQNRLVNAMGQPRNALLPQFGLESAISASKLTGRNQ